LDDAQRYVPEIRNKSTVIPNGFDPEEFEIRDGYRSLRPYIFSIGRFHKSQKGFDILIMAFRSIIDKGYDVDLIIAGDSPERKDYETLTNLLRLQERVKFFGRADRGDVVRLFNGCEFFVLPSRIEPFGIVNLEAMAAGKAIVATNVHGVPEIVKDGVNGILVKAQDDKSLANGMMKLLDDVEFRNRLAENGKRMIKDYAWDNIADRYIKIYQKILKN
jgi:glycosyltransferase involved in cell wall biosynthesis